MSFVQKTTIFLAFLIILNGCKTTPQAVDNSTPSSQVNHAVSYEAPKGRLDPETSMARSLKYNLDTIKKQITPKFIGQEAKINALKNLQKMNENNGLTSSLKELDFAILYTALSLSPSQQQTDNLLTQATSQNIILATLKAHETALYSHKKLFEYNRLKRQYQNQIASLIKKKQNISEEEIAYQKQLEENIDKLTFYIQSAEQNINDFYQLTKIENSKTEPEGKNFYEKNILSSHNAESYIKSAFENRQDLKLFPAHTFEEISLSLADQDFDFSSTVKGFYISDKAFEQKLSLYGSRQAETLLKATKDYKKNNNPKKISVLNQEFYKAVYWQIQTAYQLAKHTSTDYDMQLSNIQQLKNDIRKLEKTSKATIQQRLDLLKAHINLFENENIADQIFAERTITAIALQFYSGLLYIGAEDLSQNIDSLKTILSQKLQTKPSSVNKTQQSSTSPQNWAHQENWLEELMSEQQKPLQTQLMSKNSSKTINYNEKSTMILGSFLNTATADKEWLEMKKLCPELEQYTPIYEKTSAAGIVLFRLIVKYPTGGFKNVCICLRNHSKECILKD